MICRTPAGAGSFPGLPAVREITYTYADLDLTSTTLAHALRSLGVKRGDRVAVSLGNCAEFAALTYAIFKLGAVLVPLNPAFNAPQMAAALSHLGVGVLIIGAVTDLAYKPCRGRSNLGLLRDLVPDLHSGRVEAPAVPTLQHIVVVDNTAAHPGVPDNPRHFSSLTSFSDLAAGVSSPASAVVPDGGPLDPADTINIQFTSGTTAHPKAAMLSHTSILNNGALIAHRMGLTSDDRIVCPPPLFHCFGSVLGYMATATTGASILFPSPAFDPVASLTMAADHRATGLHGVATMYVAMLEVLASDTAPPELRGHSFTEHLRTGIAAGSSMPEALMLRLFERVGLRDLVICYGMTETAPVSCMTAPSDTLDRRTRSVGRVLPHTAVKIVDPTDRRRLLPVGERGEFAASGYLVMKGYWGDEARTREVLVSEPVPQAEDNETAAPVWWMYSGDEASMDADGYVEITGRIKDLIIRAGENIHPLEIENCLFQHPLVSEVSVVGVPDERYGECVGAFIVAHRGTRLVEGRADAEGKILGKDDVRDWVNTRLSAHLVPRYVFWADEHPKTASGKIQKFKLREMASEAVFGPHLSS